MQSSSIGKLAEALSKAQGKMENAKKDSLNPHFKSKYADLASIIDEIRIPFSTNGLSFVQSIHPTENGIRLITKILHVSGEWIESEIPLLFSKQDMQGFGSALTYARRYGLSALVGIAQEDDDGNHAGGIKPTLGNAFKASPVHPKPVTLDTHQPSPISHPDANSTALSITAEWKEMAHKLKSLQIEQKISDADLKDRVKKEFRTETIRELSLAQLSQVVSWFEKDRVPLGSFQTTNSKSWEDEG